MLVPLWADRGDDEESLFARDVDDQLIRVNKATAADYDRIVTLTIDGERVCVPAAVPSVDFLGEIIRDGEGRTTPHATTILDASLMSKGHAEGPIPTLCHLHHMEPVAVCRVCSVGVGRLEIDEKNRLRLSWEKKLVPSCHARVANEQVVVTAALMRDQARDPRKGLRKFLVQGLWSCRKAIRLLERVQQSGGYDPATKEEARKIKAGWNTPFDLSKLDAAPEPKDLLKALRANRDTIRQVLQAGLNHHALEALAGEALRKSDEVREQAQLLVELLLSNHADRASDRLPDARYEFGQLAGRLQADPDKFPRRPPSRPENDDGPPPPAIEFSRRRMVRVNHDDCILCDRCVRGCGEIRGHHVIARIGKGGKTRIGFDLATPMAHSGCVECGECMISCPTAAITGHLSIDQVTIMADAVPGKGRSRDASRR